MSVEVVNSSHPSIPSYLLYLPVLACTAFQRRIESVFGISLLRTCQPTYVPHSTFVRPFPLLEIDGVDVVPDWLVSIPPTACFPYLDI